MIAENIEEKSPKDYWGRTPLHIAAQNGYLDVCKLIAENIQEKNPQDNFGITPIQTAVDNDQSFIVEYFQTLLELPRKLALPRESCPYCPGVRLSRLMQNHIRQEHPEKFSMKSKGKMNPNLQNTNKGIKDLDDQNIDDKTKSELKKMTDETLTAPPAVKTNLKEYPTNIKHEDGNIGKVFVDILDIFTVTLARLRIGVKSANVLYIGCKDLWEYLGILGTLPSNANYNLHVLELDTWLTLLKNMDINYELTDKEVREMNIDFYNATNALKKFQNSNSKEEQYEC